MDKFLTRKRVVPDNFRTPNDNEPQITENQENDLDALTSRQEGNLDGVIKLLTLAKLSEAHGAVQQIVFSSPFASDSYKLLEVTSELADEIETANVEFNFRGQPDDYPVLCTNNKTYSVKEAETSNTLLVVPELRFSGDIKDGELFLETKNVRAMQMRYLELKEIKTILLGRLKELLHENEFEWTRPENSVEGGKLYTFSDLLDLVQMSEKELKESLARLPVIEYDGYVQMLSSQFRDRLLMELIECLDDDNEPEVTIDSISVPAFCKVLERKEPDRVIPLQAVHWLLRSHCIVNSEEGFEKYSINERAICRSKASQLLRAAVRFELSAFENLMTQLLPEGVELKIEYLDGLALIDEDLARGKTIRYLNVEDLPENDVKRLELLLSMRSQWSLETIAPFFSDLYPAMRDLNGFFTKRCRMANINNERVVLGVK